MRSTRGIGWLLAAWLAACVTVPARPAAAQATKTADPAAKDEDDDKASAIEQYKELTDPERMLEKRKKALEKQKPPFEFFRSQILPFDVLPYVKEAHWATMTLEMRANLSDYDGILRSAPVKLTGQPHEIVFERDARLIQEQQAKLAFQVFLPKYAKEMTIELTRPDAIRGEAMWQASLLPLAPHQMLMPILSPEPGGYTPWAKYQALVPASGEKDPLGLDRQRYYRLVQSQTPDKPPLLPTHPLTWTTISHIVWDGILPEALSAGQQQAMLDWLHWGGQLVLVGGPGFSLTPFQESFLAPYLPATPSGQNARLTADDLRSLKELYPPPRWPNADDLEVRPEPAAAIPSHYEPPQDIPLGPKRTVFLTGLKPVEGATPLPLGDPGGHLLGVERRIGRGRILILAIKPNDPALAAWGGLDTLVRRVVLRRPEEHWEGGKRAYLMLSSRRLSWVRYVGRDLGAPSTASTEESEAAAAPTPDVTPSTDPVAAWLDAAELPSRARGALEKASGLTIPGQDFVLKVILAYVVAIVPLNWVICRYVFRRRELAWLLAPVLAFGFAVAVERGAAYDIGYDSACDEIDVLEIQGDYPRGHLSRFAAVYSTGRVRYTIAFPNDPAALALPLSGASLRGDETVQSVWQSSPEPALVGFPVQPRSLAIFRAEQMVNLPGGVALASDPKTGARRVVNGTGLELRDAVLVEVGKKRLHRLGTIAAGAGVTLGTPEVEPPKPGKATSPKGEPDWLTVDRSEMIPTAPFLERLQSYAWDGPEDQGELRLVAWAAKPQPGEKLTPAVDRHRGFRMVVAHVAYAPPPDPLAPPYGPGRPIAATVAADRPGNRQTTSDN